MPAMRVGDGNKLHGFCFGTVKNKNVLPVGQDKVSFRVQLFVFSVYRCVPVGGLVGAFLLRLGTLAAGLGAVAGFFV